MAGEAWKPDSSVAEDVFSGALARTPVDRPAYLAKACGNDERLRQRVEALLRAHDATEGFLPEQPGMSATKIPVVANEIAAAFTEQPGDRIGRYKLREKIGEGGCGAVYMAEQEEPVRRKVALKIIKLGMDTKQVVARFEAERQALALMDHTNIAKVIDAGGTEAGRPYFVMELVGGIKITDYCDQNNLSTRERLNLFIQVCRAIQHAHQKGIIHRDIKPSNILVATQDGAPVPKVIDFGIAKATQGRLTDQTVFTAFEQFLGTPAYMSPEQSQLGGLDVDTRSDIYSLGVLLYELLTGKTPFDSKELLIAGLDAMRRTIQEKEPLTPSTRLSKEMRSQANSSKSEETVRASPRRLLQEVRGDLDCIVMKCLEKDRARRYETASGLASDICRHLNNEAVVARPPSRLYEVRKMVRRHKLGFAAAATVMMALTIGAVVSTLEAVRATRAERKSAQFGQFMKDMLKGVGPGVALGRDTTLLREILDKTVQRMGTELTNQPALEADLRATLGNVYFDLADFTNATAMHQKALAIRRQVHGNEHPDVANSLNDLAQVLQWECRLDEAEAMHRDALAIRRRLLGPSSLDVAQSLSNLGWTLFFQSAHNHPRREAALAEAEPLLRDALAIQRKELGDESLEVAKTLNWLALVLPGRNKPSEAESLANEGLSICRRLYGDAHPVMSNLFDALGMALEPQGRIVEAEGAYVQAMAVRQKFFGVRHPEMRYSYVHLSGTYRTQGRLSEAEEMYRRLAACDEKQQLYGESFEALSVTGLADVLRIQGKWEQAMSVLRNGAARDQAQILNSVAWFLATSPDEEISDPARAVACAEKAVAATGRTRSGPLDTLAASYAASGQFAKAVQVQREAIDLLQNEEEKRDYVSRLRLFEVNRPYRDDGVLIARINYLRREKRLDETELVLRKCLALREGQNPEDWRTFNTKSELGGALLGQKNYSSAEPLLVAGYEGMKEREATIPAAGKVRLKEALERLVQICEATGQPDQTAKWKQKLADFDKLSR